MKDYIAIIIYFVVLIGLECRLAYDYGKADEEQRKSNGYAMLPIAFIVWPFAVPLIPIVIIVRIFEKLGESSKSPKNQV